MYRPRNAQAPLPRRGIILLVVLVMLTLFAVVGLTFVFYADSEAQASKTVREASSIKLPEVDSEAAFAVFLNQLIYDQLDNQGVFSGGRGQSLLRNMFGYNDDRPGGANDVPFNGVGRLHENIVFLDSAGNPLPGQIVNGKKVIDAYYLINYTCYLDASGNYVDSMQDDYGNKGGMRDPERLGVRTGGPGNTLGRGLFASGFNPGYTYPDFNSVFLAAVRADGTVLATSFHRPGNGGTAGFGSLDPAANNPNWFANTYGKYMTLRPRPVDNLTQSQIVGAGLPFPLVPEKLTAAQMTTLTQLIDTLQKQNKLIPYPEDVGGDVQNLLGFAGPGVTPKNDSIWIDLGAPVITMADGRKFKMLYAPLIQDMDGKVNINVHGNIKGANLTHVSNQGWGPWEVNLNRVLTNGTEWTNLFQGRNRGAGITSLYGRYGPDQQPSNTGGIANPGTLAHSYGQADFDAAGPANPGQIILPQAGAGFLSSFPNFPFPRYDNGSNAERTNHPLRYNVFRGANFDPTNDDRVFASSNMAALLRFGDTGSEFLTSDLQILCPANFLTANNASQIRRMVTTDSYDPNVPSLTPWIYNLAMANPNQYQLAGNNNPQAPVGSAIPFPPLTWRASPPAGFPGGANPLPSEFKANDWRALRGVLGTRLDLNRALTPYPLFPAPANGVATYSGPQTPATYNGRFDDANNANYDSNNFASAAAQFQQAQADRQNLANDIYRRLLAVTGVTPAANPAAPTDAELVPRRWLAQLAVNIVDYIDEDDISTPFNFYTTGDGLPPPQLVALIASPDGNNNPEIQVPKYWVFGTELPHVAINEALAETKNMDITQPTDPVAPVKVWLELANTFQVPNGLTPLQTQDGYPVQLAMSQVANSVSASGNKNAYTPYRIVVGTGIMTPTTNENVLGRPIFVRAATTDADFLNGGQPVPYIGVGSGNQPAQQGGAIVSPYIDLAGGATNTPFFLLGPPAAANNPKFNDPFVPQNFMPAANAGTVPNNTPVMRLGTLQYTTNFAMGAVNDERTSGVAVLLRRLANPHIPFDPNVLLGNGSINPWYNPFVTVDYLDKVPLRDTINAAAAPYASRGKRQPYAAFTKLDPNNPNNVYKPAADSPVADQFTASNQNVTHTFGQASDGKPFSNQNQWLVHLDRQLISPMELLHVSGYQPYQLTQQFITGDDRNIANKFQHYVPWFDQSRRLYRIFEFAFTQNRAAGVGGAGSRIPGKFNINTIWDQPIVDALCDAAQFGDPNNPNYFSQKDVDAIFAQLIAQRTPTVVNGVRVPGPTDQPFWSLATGVTSPGDTQYLNGSGIENTLLRSWAGTGTGQRLFQTALTGNPNDAANHPYIQSQLLTKIYNNLTVRSNVFAVWVTVGFFEVTDDTTRPVKLGAEIGRSEGKHVRHRMFAIVDRSSLNQVSTTSLTAVAGAGSATITPAAMSGTTANGFPWSIQVGSVLNIDPTGNPETVTVTAVPTATTFTATFNYAHSGTYSIGLPGNPGPQARFNPHAPPDPKSVLYFSIID